jgi:hypothetical protein
MLIKSTVVEIAIHILEILNIDSEEELGPECDELSISLLCRPKVAAFKFFLSVFTRAGVVKISVALRVKVVIRVNDSIAFCVISIKDLKGVLAEQFA